jgi:hypothetical protein
MNERLDSLFSSGNILSYSSACYEVYCELTKFVGSDFKRIIIPSRGAYPFYNGALTSATLLKPECSGVIDLLTNFSLWLLPFTAETGMSDKEIGSEAVRKFWVKVLADGIRKITSPYMAFYKLLVNQVGERYGINDWDLLLEYERKEFIYKSDKSSNEKFVFIDTAISGRAICEIIKGFQDSNLKDYFIILIVDKGGVELKQEYKYIIDLEVYHGRLKQINVDEIFSEDASPLLNSGIISMVFPSLISRSLHEIDEFRNDGIIGAGLWFTNASSYLMGGGHRLNIIQSTVATLVQSGIAHMSAHNLEHFGQMTEFFVERMKDAANSVNLFDMRSTKMIIQNQLRSEGIKLNEQITVSNSHVVRVHMDETFVSKVIKNMKRV